MDILGFAIPNRTLKLLDTWAFSLSARESLPNLREFATVWH